MNDTDRGIQGFKKSEVGAAPERVFNTSDVRVEDLPDGIRLYLREKAVNLGNKKVLVNVYRLKDDGGLKDKREWCGKMPMNRKPEDHEIAEQFGGGKYVWILKWSAPDGQEAGIISDPVEIDEESGRAAHEAWKRRQVATESTPAAPAAVPAPAGGPLTLDILGVLKLMEASEEKAMARMERMAAMFQGGKHETPAEVLQSAYKGASDMMRQAVETNLQMAQQVRKSTAKELAAPAPVADPEAEAEPEGPQLPGWLEPFMPQIEKGIEKLLGGGPTSSAVKTLILSSEEWNEIFSDKDKWGQFVAAAEQKFGSDKTSKALDILLNRRKGKGK